MWRLPEQRVPQRILALTGQGPDSIALRRSCLTVEQAVQRVGISPERYRAVAVLGTGRFTEVEVREVLVVTGIDEDRLRVWQKRPRSNTRNPPAR